MSDQELEPGIYRHFKGGLYDVIGVAGHSETGERFVVYRPQYGKRRLTIRPLRMFTEIIERGEYKGPRFTLVLSNQSGPKF